MPDNIRPCPICGENMEGTRFRRGTGFRFKCYGTGPKKHGLLTLYVETLPDGSKAAVTEIGAPGVADSAKSLLERVKRLGGKGDAK